MEALFHKLSLAVEGAPPIALAASFVWGILSLALSPCHLASIPLIVGFISGQTNMTTPRAFSLSAFFAIGILAMIAIIGGITAALGRMLGDVGPWGNYFVALIFFLVGLYLLEILPQFTGSFSGSSMKRSGPVAALLLGLIFGVALGPCTFAYMAPILAVVFKLGAQDLLYGMLLMAAYGVGHCSMIVLAGTSTERVQRFLNWSQNSSRTILLRKACGALLLLAGLYIIYIA